MEDDDRVALIDLDGTAADYDASMRRELERLRAPDEPPLGERSDDEPPHVEARRKLIQRMPGFWRGLPRLAPGFQIIDELRQIGFRLHVLTKGPLSSPNAWTEKVEWCREHLPDADVTISQDKALVYGRVLVDDYPPYFLPWLKHRPRGLVVCVAHPWNEGVEHPNVIRYTGDNLPTVRARLERAFARADHEPL
jgi:hypothetical protein